MPIHHDTVRGTTPPLGQQILPSGEWTATIKLDYVPTSEDCLPTWRIHVALLYHGLAPTYLPRLCTQVSLESLGLAQVNQCPLPWRYRQNENCAQSITVPNRILGHIKSPCSHVDSSMSTGTWRVILVSLDRPCLQSNAPAILPTGPPISTHRLKKTPRL